MGVRAGKAHDPAFTGLQARGEARGTTIANGIPFQLQQSSRYRQRSGLLQTKFQ